ncbi:cytochrome C oxidase assembly protein [Celeribacter arenosi]|uniref:Cytochrome C oxidase assembly protein n=1 Tax=Celeribacter arenosi TaxID=792649 RepID=A0ABP7K827_9RHOB
MAITKLHEVHKRRRSRNVGLGFALALFVVLLMGLTIAKVTVLDPARSTTSEVQQ